MPAPGSSGPNGEPVAACGKGAFVVAPHPEQTHCKRRCRSTTGATGGRSMASYSPITQFRSHPQGRLPHNSRKCRGGGRPRRLDCRRDGGMRLCDRAWLRRALMYHGAVSCPSMVVGRTCATSLPAAEASPEAPNRPLSVLSCSVLKISATHPDYESRQAQTFKGWVITTQDFPMLDSVPSATGTLAVFSQQTLFWPIVRRDIKPHIVEMRRQPS